MVKFYGVTHLELFALGSFTYFNEMLQSFPDLEYLEIWSTVFSLQAAHFQAICQHMPKLRELTILYNGPTTTAIFNPNTYSLKDLKSLEKLKISENVQLNGHNIHWPLLPKLKELTLDGDFFKGLNQVKMLLQAL